MTRGLDAVRSEIPFIVNKNGIAAVTGWLSGEFWSVCSDPVSTDWFGCIASSISSVQKLTFSGQPSSGTFTINWEGYSTTALAFNAAAEPDIEDALRLIPGLEEVIVNGGFGNPSVYNISFYGYEAEAPLVTITNNTDVSSIAVSITREYINGVVSTSWTDCFSTPSTTWTPCEGN